MKNTLIYSLFISTLLLMPMGLVGVTPTDSGTGVVKKETTVPSKDRDMKVDKQSKDMMRPSDNTMTKDRVLPKDKVTKPGDKVDQGKRGMSTVGWIYVGPRYRGFYSYGYPGYGYSGYYNNWGPGYGYGHGYGYGGWHSGWRGPYVFIG